MAAVTRTIALGERRFTRIGLGTNRLDDTEANRSFLSAAVGAGLDFIDTAHLYAGGESERTIGATLAPFPEQVVVATKGNFLPGGGIDGLRAELEQSLERLRTEVIDLYYLHRVDPDVPLEEMMGVLKEYLDAGRIAHVGLSEVSVAEIQRARSIVPIAAVQNEFNIGERMHDEVLDFCASEGIIFVPFYPLQGDSSAVTEIAERHGAAPSQIKLAWLLRRSEAMAPIPGTRSLEHLRMNLDALDIELSTAEFEALSAA
jgi:aryl-alcohol dehydrogenase-like predicted oxidoreductase